MLSLKPGPRAPWFADHLILSASSVADGGGGKGGWELIELLYGPVEVLTKPGPIMEPLLLPAIEAARCIW